MRCGPVSSWRCRSSSATAPGVVAVLAVTDSAVSLLGMRKLGTALTVDAGTAYSWRSASIGLSVAARLAG